MRQHAVERSPSMPCFDGVEYKFGTIQLAYNASHIAIIARRRFKTLLLGAAKDYFNNPASRMYFKTPECINSRLGAAASVFASVDSAACASFCANAPSL